MGESILWISVIIWTIGFIGVEIENQFPLPEKEDVRAKFTF